MISHSNFPTTDSAFALICEYLERRIPAEWRGFVRMTPRPHFCGSICLELGCEAEACHECKWYLHGGNGGHSPNCTVSIEQRIGAMHARGETTIDDDRDRALEILGEARR